MRATFSDTSITALNVYLEQPDSSSGTGFDKSLGLRLTAAYYYPNSWNWTKIYLLIKGDSIGNYDVSDQSIRGAAGYLSASGEFFSSYKANNASYGQINVITTHPLFTGNFTLTCTDSTKITGTFSCPGL